MQNYFSLPDRKLAENLIFAFRFYERTKRDKSEFLTKLVGIILPIIIQKYLSNSV